MRSYILNRILGMIPTLAIMREKVLLFSQAGALPESALTDIITQAKGLDMAEVHAQIAEQEAKTKQDQG